MSEWSLVNDERKNELWNEKKKNYGESAFNCYHYQAKELNGEILIFGVETQLIVVF